MKIHIYALAALLMLTAATSALAQSQALSATIPFDFYVSGKLLPAGTYVITPTSHGEAILVSDRTGNSAFVITVGSARNHSASLSRVVFRQYGSASFLTTIYWTGFQNGKMVATSKMEKELAKIEVSPSPITIAAK
jgi:hypothetical protein